MTMNNSSNIDKQLILLSTDWFQDFVFLILPTLDVSQRTLIQNAAQCAVKYLMGRENSYWNVSFDSERLSKTQKCFVENLETSKIDTQLLLQNMRELGSAKDEGQTIAWLVMTITQELLADAKSFPLGQQILSKIDMSYKFCQANHIADEMERCAVASTTAWDTYIRGLTSDLPSFTADYAVSIVRDNDFGIFWKKIKETFTETEFQTIREYYSNKISSLGVSNIISLPV